VVEEMDATVSSSWDLRRAAYAVGAVALLVASIVVFVSVDAGWWVFPVFAIGPDLAFLAGIGHKGTLEHGQMPSRAVPVYNALHRVYGPIALGVLAVAGLLPPALLVGALVWGLHIFVDRAIGYGLRTHDGFQRA
jgi:hypothetical protein